MKEATIQEHPDFPLMKPEDVSKDRYMRMPSWLFTNPHYIGLSLDAKIVYTFLTDRFSLSRKNGWINERGEVFVIFPRLALAKEMRVCEQRVTEAFRELRRAWLI